MKKYTPSNELIDILIKNGFTEITKEKRPDHFKNLTDNGYDPNKVKRVFSINSNLKNYIELQYLTIHACYNGGAIGVNMKTELNADELKSIIAFYKLPPQTKSAIKRRGLNIISLYRDYYHIKKQPDLHKRNKGDLMLLGIFENVEL